MNVGATKTIKLETTDTDWDFDTAVEAALIVHVNKKKYLTYKKSDNTLKVDTDPKKASALITRDESRKLVPGMLGIELYVQKNNTEHGISLYLEVEPIKPSFTTDL